MFPELYGRLTMHRFVDVEGQGAEDNTYDTLLALPLLLTSKVPSHSSVELPFA